MPLLETRPDAAASVYAHSLFEVEMARGGQAAVESTLGELEDILEMARADAKLGEFFVSRIISTAERSAALERIFTGKAEKNVVHFLQVLNRKGRLSEITGIVAAYDNLVQNAFGRIEVDVFTTTPLDDADKAALAAKLKAVLGRDPVIHPYIDGSMIGGIKLQIGDQLIDGSIASSLRKLNETLNVRGSAIVRGATDRIMDSGGTSNGTAH